MPALRKRRRIADISRRPANLSQLILLNVYRPKTYHSQSNPGLSQVDEQTILRPSPRCSNFLHSQVGPILLKMNLHNQCNSLHYKSVSILKNSPSQHYTAQYLSLTTSLMLRQQSQSFIRLSSSLQHCPANNLNGAIVCRGSSELLYRL